MSIKSSSKEKEVARLELAAKLKTIIDDVFLEKMKQAVVIFGKLKKNN